MLAITAKRFPGNDQDRAGWVIINANGRGYSDVLELAQLAGISYRNSPLSHRYETKRAALQIVQEIMDRASERTGGASARV